VDTDPSGALITAEKNTVTSAGIQDLIKHEMKIPQRDYLWGDDAYATMRLPESRTITDVIQEREAIALRAGQVFDTLGGSWSGRGVHFLQVFTLWGQRIKRRTAIDHENPTKYAMGDIPSLLTKYTMMGTRGGGVDMTNMLILSTIIQGSRFKVFGRQAFLPFPSVAAPGGLVNMVLMGFPAPNSKLWLSTNYQHIMSDHNKADTMLMVQPKIEQPDVVGRRMLRDAESLDVTVTIGGRARSEKASDLLHASRKVLLESTRVESSGGSVSRDISKTAIDNNITDNYEHMAYTLSVHGAANRAVGTQTTEKHLKKWFVEKALIESGMISHKRGAEPSEAREFKMKSRLNLDENVRLGNYIVSWSFDSNTYLKVGEKGKTKERVFKLFVNGDFREDFGFMWHPFYSQPQCMKMLLAFTGVHAGKNVLTIKQLTAKFSPHKFRSDIHAEDVIGMLEKFPSHKARSVLLYIGFSSDEATSLSQWISSIPLYKDLSQVDEYSGLDDSIKCADTSRIVEFLRTHIQQDGPSMYDYMEERDLAKIVLVQFVSLLTDEFNVAYSAGTVGGEPIIRLPIPNIKHVRDVE
jgi:hypothetical protein